MAITSYKAVVGYYNSAGTPNITTAVTGQLSDGWIPIGAPILTDAYGQCTQMMAKTDATPVITTSAYTVVTAANPQPPDATWDAQGEPLWIDTATYLQAYTKGGAYLNLASQVYGVLPVANGGTGASDIPNAKVNFGLERFQQFPIETTVSSPGYARRLTVSDSGSWGVANVSEGGWVALGVEQGGTGAVTAAAARTNLGLGTVATLNSISLTTNVSGTLSVGNGGTGAVTAAAARTNLGVAYGTTAGTVTQGNDNRLNTVDGKTGGTISSEVILGTGGTGTSPILRLRDSNGSLQINSDVDDTGIGFRRIARFGSADNQVFLEVLGGYRCCPGITGVASRGDAFNFYYTASGLQAWINTGNIGTIQMQAVSDAKFKKDIKPVVDTPESALSEVVQWEVSNFKYKERGVVRDSHEYFGFIANTLREISPECVRGTSNTPFDPTGAETEGYYLDHIAMIAKLTLAIQGLAKKLESGK